MKELFFTHETFTGHKKKKKVDSKNGLDRFEMGENAGQRRTQVPEPGLSGGGLGS